MSTSKVLVLNAGSSSLKFQLFEARSAGSMSVLAKGVVDRIGTPQASLRVDVGDIGPADASNVRTMQDAAELIFRHLSHHSIDVVGYRVVHGGDRFDEPARV